MKWSAVLLLLVSCSGSQVAVQRRSVLSMYPRIAVVHVGVNLVRNRGNTSPLNKYVDLLDRFLYQNVGKWLGVKVSGRGSSGDQTGDLHSLALESIHRNFLERGFLPVERDRMASIYKEITFSQSGLSSADRKEVGQLASADALYFAEVNISMEKGWFQDKIRLSYTGRLISVEEGYVLMSGEAVRSHSEFEPGQIPDLVTRWFRRVPVLKD
ncbi:MAG: hypothetical protein HS115_13230 [Spirochaetales bacterium]|nr:hypothetical protein [Spirochaetales bacterium]